MLECLSTRVLSMALTDIADAMKIIRSEQKKRDKEFLKLLKLDWRISRLADHFKISKQRAQQIAARLRKKHESQ